MKAVVALLLLAAVATAQQFPFTDGPLEASSHSNKVFFQVNELADVAGVWKGVNAIIQPIFQESWLFDGVTPFNLTCEAVATYGWSYDLFIQAPRSMVIEVDPEKLEPGTMGAYIDVTARGTFRYDILDFTPDGRMHHTNDSSWCTKWRPYLDWELGKTMIIQNRRYHFYPGDNGATEYGTERCDYPVSAHPSCFEGTFTYDGVERTGVYVDVVAFYECIAGPCLDLAHGLPGFVQTQGYVPFEPEETQIGSAEQVVAENGK